MFVKQIQLVIMCSRGGKKIRMELSKYYREEKEDDTDELRWPEQRVSNCLYNENKSESLYSSGRSISTITSPSRFMISDLLSSSSMTRDTLSPSPPSSPIVSSLKGLSEFQSHTALH